MNNNKEKYSEIYDQYIDKIYRFVFLRVSSQEIAEDITSKVFTKGWEAFQRQEIVNPNAFLYQIARNTIADHYREKSRTNVVSADFVPEMVDPGAGLEEKAILNSEFHEVKLAIQNLKQDYQDIIICHYIDDMKVSEIAEFMGKPEGTVRVMLHRGLKALKKEMGGLKKGQIKEV